MTPPTDKDESQTRAEIDLKLELAGWVIQDRARLNLHEALGVAVREMVTRAGSADYFPFEQASGLLMAKDIFNPEPEALISEHNGFLIA